MEVRVIREACCAADDQLGPLETVYCVDRGTTLADLVEKIRASRFLQFSSTHDRLSGEVDGVALVEVQSDGAAPRFHVDPAEPVDSAIGPGMLWFRFREGA